MDFAASIKMAMRLATVATLLANVVILAYGVATHDRTRTFREQWPGLGRWSHLILVGLLLETAGWFIHQSYWWVHEVARARHALPVADFLEQASWVMAPIHFVIIAGGVMVTAVVAEDLLGTHWRVIVPCVVAAFGVLGVMLAG